MAINILDANETAFWTKELEAMKARTYDIDYPELGARKAFPVGREGGEGVRSITYQVWDHAGVAAWIANYASDIPRAEVKGHTVTVPVHRMAESFGMSIDEIKEGRRTGRPLDARKMAAVRDGHEALLNTTAFNGNATLQLQGLFSHPSIPNGEATTGAWTTSTTSPDEILADVRDGFSAIDNATSGVEIADTMLIPRTYFNHLAMTRMADGSDKTILNWLIENVPYLNGPDSIMPMTECNSVTSLAGSALDPASPVVVYYRKDPSKLELEIPEDINFLPPERQGLEEVTIGTMTTGGLNVYKPISIYIQIMTAQS